MSILVVIIIIKNKIIIINGIIVLQFYRFVSE